MQRLAEQILEQLAGLPEGASVSAKELLHLGTRGAVDQALSRLVKRGQLLRAGRGLYVRPVETRFGQRPPSVAHLVQAIAEAKGETIASHGATAANALGLTTQVPVRAVYLTSGRTRTLKVGQQTVELRHAPRWQLTLAGRPAGEAIRALAWLGEGQAETALRTLRQRLAHPDMRSASKTDPTTKLSAASLRWIALQLARAMGRIRHGATASRGAWTNGSMAPSWHPTAVRG